MSSTVLVLGGTASGKTLLGRQLCRDGSAPVSLLTQATTGVEMDELTVKNAGGGTRRIRLREVGSQMVPMWLRNAKSADAVLVRFVVEVNWGEMVKAGQQL